jgi:hypothetical protein
VERWLEVKVQVLPAAAEAAAEILRMCGAPNGVVVDEQPEAVTITAYYPQDERLEGRLTGSNRNWQRWKPVSAPAA